MGGPSRPDHRLKPSVAISTADCAVRRVHIPRLPERTLLPRIRSKGTHPETCLAGTKAPPLRRRGSAPSPRGAQASVASGTWRGVPHGAGFPRPAWNTRCARPAGQPAAFQRATRPAGSRARYAICKRRRETARRKEAGVGRGGPRAFTTHRYALRRRHERGSRPMHPWPCTRTRAKVGMDIEFGLLRPWPLPWGRWRDGPLCHLNEAGRWLHRSVALLNLRCRGRIPRTDGGRHRRYRHPKPQNNQTRS